MTRPRHKRVLWNSPRSRTTSPRRHSFKALWVLPVGVIAFGLVAARVDDARNASTPTLDFGSSPDFDDPVTEATSAATPTATSSVGRPADRVQIGASRDIGSFAMTVVEFVPNATTSVIDASFLNEAPAPGMRYVLVEIQAENQTATDATWWVEMLVELRDGDGVAYPAFEGPIAPDPLPFEATAPGVVAIGNLVFTVPDVVADFELVVRPGFGVDEIVWQLTP